MPTQPFTKKVDDLSSREGFRFKFYCDKCDYGLETGRVDSKAADKKRWTNFGMKAFRAASPFLRNYVPISEETAKKGEDATKVAAGEFDEKYEEEREVAKETLQKEAMQYFNQCPMCKRWVCQTCWNTEEKLCVDDAGQLTICPACHKPRAGEFCSEDGTPLFVKCPTCGAKFSIGTKFCNKDASRLG